MKKCIILLVLIFFFPAIGLSGTTGSEYFVDPTAPNGGNGRYDTPWNNMSQVNAHRFSTGDDLYFKAGTTLAMKDNLKIDWDGSKSNPVIIGAYYGKGLAGLGGKTRPILKGSYRTGGKNVPRGDYEGLIHYSRGGAGYITVQDIEIRESYSNGITINSGKATITSHNVVKNCVVKDIGRQGITFSGSVNSSIENCRVEQVCQRKIKVAKGTMKNSGAAITITGDRSRNNTVKGCTVTKAFEGIGIYKGPADTTIENNTVYNFSDMGIYIDNATHAIIRNNLVYNPSVIWHSKYEGLRTLIQVDSEGHVKGIKKEAGDCEIYGNYLAGGKVGILLASRSNKHGVHQKNNKIYKNIIVESSKFNIALSKGSKEKMADVVGWKNNQIHGNYSFLYGKDPKHTNVDSWPGVIWEGNFFNSSVEGDVARSARIKEVELKMKSGWGSLKPGELTRSMFEITGETAGGDVPRVTNLRIGS